MVRSGGQALLLHRARLGALLDVLRADERTLIGPTVRDGAVVHAEIAGVDDLPVGWTTAQAGGRHRLERRDDGAVFGWAVGPQSWKHLFFLPRLRLWSSRREGAGFVVEPEALETPALALFGVRPCDLQALAIQDRVFVVDGGGDPDYAARRRDVLVVAVNCGEAGGTCFCASMETGPRARGGFDLLLTEILDGAHRFLVEVGSARGAAIVARLALEPATDADRAAADAAVAHAARTMGRQLGTDDLHALLLGNLEHPRWDEVAARCLACTNCTLVCPTCFCSTVEDVTDLAGEQAERRRVWDSCFTLDHSYLHGGSVRTSTRARYRQWLTHKFATWIDQFGTSGCVGCGRCITWCPVGIDVTEELAALRPPPAERRSPEERSHGIP